MLKIESVSLSENEVRWSDSYSARKGVPAASSSSPSEAGNMSRKQDDE